MKAKQWWLYGLALTSIVFAQGCTTFGSGSKAPVMKIHTGGSKSDRQQEFLLKQVKAGHKSNRGIVLGLRHFTDAGRPISGAREKDTLYIKKGPYKGSYLIDKVLRLVTRVGRKRKRRVIIRIAGSFFKNENAANWATIHSGSLGVVTGKGTFTDAVTDAKKFPPQVAVGSQLVVTGDGQTRYYTIIGNTLDRKVGKLQRVAYRTAEPLPKGLRNLRYQIRIPKRAGATRLSYNIAWRGGGLSEYNFTIGINRRRYGQAEIEDLLKNNPKSKRILNGTAGKRNAAAILRYTGVVTLVVGGFLALVRRDDFPGAAQAVPWSIVGAGAALLGVSIPLDISANGDFLRASNAYNKDIRSRLKLSPLKASAPSKGKTIRLAGPAPARAVLYSTQK